MIFLIRLGYQKQLFLASTYCSCSFIIIPALGHYIQAITNKAKSSA